MGWKWGCQPFSCRCSQNVTHSRKEIWSTYLFKASIPSTPFVNSNHKLPTRSRFLRATVHSALWLHHAHPFVAATKNLSHAEKQRVWSRSYGLICYNAVIVLSVVLQVCDCCFSNSGLPAFQLPMFAKCDTQPKGDLVDLLV